MHWCAESPVICNLLVLFGFALVLWAGMALLGWRLSTPPF
jgi:hypothetical protein